MNSTVWTDSEVSILRALAVQVRIASRDQIKRGWFGAAPTSCELTDDALMRLTSAGLIQSRIVEAHPILELKRPLFTWRLKDREPTDATFESLAEVIRARWAESEVPVEVYFATSRSVRLFGAFSDAIHPKHCEATHDLHLAEVFVRYRLKTPLLVRKWNGESAFPKLGFDFKGMKDPDAFLIDADARALRIIEFAGKYSADHLHAFHRHCAGGAARRIPVRPLSVSQKRIRNLYASGGTNYELW